MSSPSHVRRRRGPAFVAAAALLVAPLTAVTAGTLAAQAADDATLLAADFDDGALGDLVPSGASGTFVEADGSTVYQVARANNYDGVQTPEGLFDGLAAGTVVTLTAQARIVDGDTGVPIRWVTKPAYGWLSPDSTLTDEWTTVTNTFTVPATDAPEQIYLGTGPYPEPDPALAFTYQLDDVRVTAKAPDTGEPEVVLGNDFESASEPWGARGSTVALTGDDAHGGASALAVTNRSASWAGTQADLTSTLVAGSTYDVSAWVRLAPGTTGSSIVKITAQTNTGSGDDAYEQIASATVTADEWVELSSTYTRPAGLASVILYFEAADIDSVHPDFLVDDIEIVGKAASGGGDYVETDPDFVPGGALNPTATPVASARGTDKTAALTFDDGPNGATTLELLDFLKANGVPATFCVIGQNVTAPGGADVLKRIVQDGHALCNHSTTYDSLKSLDQAGAATRLKANLATIRTALGDPTAEVPYFRAPNGEWGQTGPVAVALGMQPLAVTNLVNDWDGAENAGDEAKIAAALRSTITSHPGQIALVHDGGGNRTAGVAAVKTVVSELLADGWTFTLPAGGAAPKGVTLADSDFEDGTMQGWSARADGSGPAGLVEVTDDDAHESTYAVRVAERTSQGQGIQIDVTDSATPGASYDLSAWIKFEGTPGDMTLSARTVTGEDAKFSNLVQITGLSSSQWVHVTGTFTMPAFDTAAELYFETKYVSTGTGNISPFLVDDISVVSTPVAQIEDLTPLKDTVDFPVGVAIDSRETAGTASELLLKHFDQVTSENYMKVEAWYSGTGVDTFRLHPEAKTLMDYAQDNDLRVYGHVLLWHSQTPDWFYQDGSGNDLSKAALRQRLHDHIGNVAQALSDQYGPFGSPTNPLVAFDVVNEVIDDGTSTSDGMRRSAWYRIYGDDTFVDDAFEFANEAFNGTYAASGAVHPVTLFINDYNTEQTGKRARYKALVERLIARDVPIDGVGHQFHVALSTPVGTLEDAIADFEGMKKADGTPLVQAVTELDVFVGSPDTAKSIDQGYYLKAAFDSFREHADSLFSVTTWGLTDGRSWRATNNGKPLLFDDWFKAKPAFYGAAGLALPAAIRSADAFAADGGDYTAGSDEWQRLPLHPVGDTARFQLRWSPDALTVFVDVDDATKDAGDAVQLETADGVVTVARSGAAVVERAGGWSVVATVPLEGAAQGDSVDLDVRVVNGSTTTGWNTPGVLGTVALVEPLSYTEIPQASSTPVVDGDVDDVWADAAEVTTGKVTSGSKGAVGTFRLLWQENTLFVLADVVDPTVDTKGSDPWTKDSVEIYVDGGNVKNGSYRYDDTQIRIDADGALSFGTGDEQFQRDRVTSSVTRTDTGYRVEAAISLLEWGGLGTYQGLDVQVNDASDGNRTSIINWADPTGTGYQTTAHWGVGRLVAATTEPGTDPGTEGTDPGTKPGTKPGTDPGTGPGTKPGTEPTEPTDGATAPASAPVLHLSLHDVRQGGALRVRGTGFEPGERVEVWLHSAPRLLLAATAAADGSVDLRVTIPSDATIGTHTLEVRGLSSGLSGEATVRVLAADAQLGATGFQTGLVAVAAAALVAGLVLLLVVRRGRRLGEA